MKNKTIPGGARVGKAIFIFFRFFLYKIETKKKSMHILSDYWYVSTLLEQQTTKTHTRKKKERKKVKGTNLFS